MFSRIVCLLALIMQMTGMVNGLMVPRARGCVSGPSQGHLGTVYANFLGPILDTCQSSSVDM